MARYINIFLLIVSLIVLDSSLINALDSIKPDHLTPNDNMPTTVVLEKDADTDMAISVANLEAMILTYDRLTAKGRDGSLNIKYFRIDKGKDMALLSMNTNYIGADYP